EPDAQTDGETGRSTADKPADQAPEHDRRTHRDGIVVVDDTGDEGELRVEGDQTGGKDRDDRRARPDLFRDQEGEQDGDAAHQQADRSRQVKPEDVAAKGKSLARQVAVKIPIGCGGDGSLEAEEWVLERERGSAGGRG